jgi:hypothetical protein
MNTDKPILMSGPMVRAILEDRKLMTRRVQKMAYDSCGDPIMPGDPRLPCPYPPGTRLWVRETWQEFFADEMPGRNHGPDGRMGVPANPDRKSYVYYRADGEATHSEHGAANWRPSIFMPRWASRLTLEVTEVRVQRVQDITHKDALAEGVSYDVSLPDGSPVPRFQKLWNSINQKRGYGWDTNPWVWAYTFRRVE